MPNGGPRPDCIHCQWFRGRPYNEERSHCELHKMDVPDPIYLFCPSYIDPEPEEDDWLDKELNREQLQNNMMYIWIGGYEVKFFHVPLATIAEYKTWTKERFWDELEKLVEKYRDNK